MGETIAIITTRFINSMNTTEGYEFKSYEFDEEIFKSFFKILEQYFEKEEWKKQFKEQVPKNIKEFFNLIGVSDISEMKFDQNYFELLVKGQHTNIFFFYHYPDRDLKPFDRWKGYGGAEYVNSVIKTISKEKKLEITKAILILHKGDLEGVSEKRFIEILKEKMDKQADIKLLKFSHDRNHPIVSQFILNPHFFENCVTKPIEYLNNWVDPSEKNKELSKKFKDHIDGESNKT